MGLRFEYDASSDVLTIEGLRYSGELFRGWAEGGLELYEPFEIIERDDGVITLHRLAGEDVRGVGSAPVRHIFR